jgi:hypothetical protein
VEHLIGQVLSVVSLSEVLDIRARRPSAEVSQKAIWLPTVRNFPSDPVRVVDSSTD